jgi:endonuclease-3 related protein
LKDIQGDPGLQRTELENDRGPYVGSPGRPRIRRFAHDPALDELFLELHLEFGPQHWWPAATPFEVIVGAILTQNTAWRNVELALAALANETELTPAALLTLPTKRLENALHPSGYYRAKARKLAAISRWYLEVGGLRALRERPLARVRAELLEVFGIGPETADSILCYAAGRRTVIVDAYTRRLLARHGFLGGDEPYEHVRAWIAERLVRSQLIHEEFHALCVRAGYPPS